jgi:hypothetical protein
MRRTNHPVELDVCASEGDGHIIIGRVIPTVTSVIESLVIVVAVGAVTPTTPNVVELVLARPLHAVVNAGDATERDELNPTTFCVINDGRELNRNDAAAARGRIKILRDGFVCSDICINIEVG